MFLTESFLQVYIVHFEILHFLTIIPVVLWALISAIFTELSMYCHWLWLAHEIQLLNFQESCESLGKCIPLKWKLKPNILSCYIWYHKHLKLTIHYFTFYCYYPLEVVNLYFACVKTMHHSLLLPVFFFFPKVLLLKACW